jgi:protein TonB
MAVTAPHDLLDQKERLSGPFAGSLALHAGLVGMVAVYMWADAGPRVSWGSPDSLGGGSTAITPVSKIPLPNRGRENRLANDTQSQVPQPPKPDEAKKAREEDPDAIAIKGREAKDKKTTMASKSKYRPPGADQPNQLYSQQGQAASSDMYGLTQGGGSVGIGKGGPFGDRFGYYAQLLRERVAQNWKTQSVDARVRTAPTVIITFEILRNGSIRDIRLLQRSGIPALDYSCQRAIADAAPFPQLPAGFNRDSALIEFWFELKR